MSGSVEAWSSPLLQRHHQGRQQDHQHRNQGIAGNQTGGEKRPFEVVRLIAGEALMAVAILLLAFVPNLLSDLFGR